MHRHSRHALLPLVHSAVVHRAPGGGNSEEVCRLHARVDVIELLGQQHLRVLVPRKDERVGRCPRDHCVQVLHHFNLVALKMRVLSPTEVHVACKEAVLRLPTTCGSGKTC